jgi:hypothetical protein
MSPPQIERESFLEAWGLLISQRTNQEVLIAQPHLLYISDRQAELYEKATTRNPRYASALDRPVIALLKKHMHEIFSTVGQIVNFIDLGPGYPTKSLLIVDYLLARGVSVTYSPVDVSAHFLRIAVKAATQRNISVVPFQHRFEDLGELLKARFESKVTRIIFLGLTFNNFALRDISEILANITRRGDICLICLQPDDNMHADDLLKPYTGDKIKTFAFEPMARLGFVDEDFIFEPIFEEDCVKTSFVLRHDMTLNGANFFAGQRFVTAKSYRLPIDKTRFELDRKLSIVGEYADNATNITLMQLTGK